MNKHNSAPDARGNLNNPLNIRRIPGQHWQGEVPQRQGLKPTAFVRFQSVEWGLRAAFCILRTYARRYHAVSIRDIIARWAPPSENLTEHYVRNVCLWTGFGGCQKLTEGDWPRLVKAMARQESGIELSQQTILRGFYLYKLF